MKKIILSLGLLLISALFGIGFGVYTNEKLDKDSDRVYAQASISYQGFDDILENADVVVIGTVHSINEYSSYDEYFISVDEIKKGDVEKEIFIKNYLYDYAYTSENTKKTGSTNLDYEIGKSYIFVLQHVENVYEDTYMILSDVYIPMDNMEKSMVLSEKLNYNNCEEYIDQYTFKSEHGKGNELSINYIKSDDEDKIISESAYIAKVEIRELLHSTEVVDVYICSVTESIKGDMSTMSDNTVIIPFFKNTVEVGRGYVVCVDSDSKDSIIYTLSSKNSVMDLNKIEKIKNRVRR